MWKNVSVIIFMFRAKPLFDCLSKIDKMAECENDTVWHWAEIFDNEIESMKQVDLSEPSEDESIFFASFSGIHNGKQYFFGLKKNLTRFRRKVQEAVRQLNVFVKMNTEELPELNKSIEFFKALGAVFDVTFWIADLCLR